jgi:hypothetical protein
MKTQNTTNAAHQKGAIITFNAEKCYAEKWIILDAIGNPESPTAYKAAPYGITRPNCRVIRAEFSAEYLRSNELISII